MQSRERGHVLHVVRREGRTLARSQVAGRWILAGHHQTQNQNYELQARGIR